MDTFQQLQPDETFRFLCHPGISCFNHCCRDLNQFLTPYDILRLKNRLCLPSQEFLKKYTVSHIGPRSGLPVTSLKMVPEEGFVCPFVSPSGCSVYEDRPGACRTYPLGRMATRERKGTACRVSYFLIREKHCLGFQESKEWTVEAWRKNQKLDTYNAMNDLMMGILSLKNRSGKKQLTDKECDLFSMACYDLDRFRDFALAEGLLGSSSAGDGTKKAVHEDDLALMQCAMEWIKGEIFGGSNRPA